MVVIDSTDKVDLLPLTMMVLQWEMFVCATEKVVDTSA